MLVASHAQGSFVLKPNYFPCKHNYLVILSIFHNNKDFSYNHAVAIVGLNYLLDVRC
jgi:hypothetical protein